MMRPGPKWPAVSPVRRAWAVACKARKRGVEMGASRLASERGVEMGHRGLASVASRLSQCVPGRREGGGRAK